MPAEDIRHPEKQPNSSKGGRKKYRRQKKRHKREGRGVPSQEGVLKREKFPNTRKPSHCRICAELWKHRGQHKREKKINKQLKIADCEPYGNSPSREAAQTPAHGISKLGLGREAGRGLCPLE